MLRMQKTRKCQGKNMPVRAKGNKKGGFFHYICIITDKCLIEMAKLLMMIHNRQRQAANISIWYLEMSRQLYLSHVWLLKHFLVH